MPVNKKNRSIGGEKKIRINMEIKLCCNFNNGEHPTSTGSAKTETDSRPLFNKEVAELFVASSDEEDESDGDDGARVDSDRESMSSSDDDLGGRSDSNDQIGIDDEEIGVAETYAHYEPSKLKLGQRHPDPVVESTSLASVEPTDIWYKLSIPEASISEGALSALQLEAIIYAAQQHERFLPDGSRAGFLIGDGTGVGKGRTVAGIIFENYLKGRKKALWVSVSNDLKYDCERDLKDIGASRIKVHPLSKMKYVNISSSENGGIKDGVVYCTYSSLIGKTQSNATHPNRLQQLLQWCGNEYDGLIIFDECHQAKNLRPSRSKKPTRKGLAVWELQKRLPKARIVYVSATGASEPRHMAYMTRLGMWGVGSPFLEFSEFLGAVEKRGVGTMEIVAIDMKLRGMYIARQLSFQGVTFRIEEVPISKEFIDMYNDSVDLWVEIKEKLTEEMGLFVSSYDEFVEIKGNKKKNKNAMVWGQFWAAHQRFFKYLCMAPKVKHAAELAKAAVEDGKCVVIGLLSTGEAQTLNQLERDEGELTDFVSSAKGVLRNFVEKHYPSSTKTTATVESDESDNFDWLGLGESDLSNSETSCDSDDSDEMLWEGRTPKTKKRGHQKKTNKWSTKKAKVDVPTKNKNTKKRKAENDLLEKIEILGERLPPSTLDHLIDELGGPKIVAEMTGRKGRVVQNDGTIQYEFRAGIDAPLETLNLMEKRKFMNGEKKIAIISEVASLGISLHSDRRVLNQCKRVHITMELPWSADRAMQQFGRTHRSNQANAPEYVFLISDLAGERRFASTVAKQLESLGALTHGDRRATETRDFSRFNVYNKYGYNALKKMLRGLVGTERMVLPPPADYVGDFFSDTAKALTSVGLFVKKYEDGDELKLHNDSTRMTTFLNRLLGIKVDLQNRLFKYFSDVLQAVIAKAKRDGKFDLGILDLGSAGEEVKRVQTHTFLRKHTTGLATTQLHVVHVERGMSWEEATRKYAELSGPEEGFYISRYPWRNGKRTAVLAIFSPLGNSLSDGSHSRDLYVLYRPNVGLQSRRETFSDLRFKYKKVDTSEAEAYWKDQHVVSDNTCSHIYWSGQCRTVNAGIRCEYGLRKQTYNILTGSVLTVWTRVEKILKKKYKSEHMQVVRLKTNDGYRTIGTIIPKSCVKLLRKELASDAEKTTEENYAANNA